MIIDTHSHYDDAQFAADLPETMAKVFGGGVEKVITCGTNFEDCQRVLQIAEQYDGVYAAIGIYPHETHKYSWDEQRLKALLLHKKVVAVGEIGLDYHYDDSPREIQLDWAARQLELAVKLQLPVSFHDRKAHEDTTELLRRYRPQGVVHCFSGSVHMAQEIVDIGMYIGVGGVITFKNARVAVQVVQSVPLSRILLETDAPYMTPEPIRGQRNRSDYLCYVAQSIARIKGVSTDEVISTTTQNAKELFRFGE